VRRSNGRRLAGALVEVARSRPSLSHVPTVLKLRAIAHFDGRELSSYLLDPKVNYVPELPLGGRGPARPACAVLHRTPRRQRAAL
jgi:hypothetical protein